MRLGVKDIAGVLKVSEKKIFRWIKKGSLPFYQVNDHYRLNKTDLLEWFFSQKKYPSTSLIVSSKKKDSLSLLLKKGGIHYHLACQNKESALRTMIDLLPLPQNQNKDFLFKMISARESIGYIESGDGIDLPHVRNPIILHLPQPKLALFFFNNRIDFGSKQGKMVDTRFLILSRTIAEHVDLLSRLFSLLNASSLRALLYSRASEEEILKEMERLKE